MSNSVKTDRRRSRWLLRRFPDDTSFVVSGPAKWNALRLGTTAGFAATRGYNTKRSGTFKLGGRVFDLHRIASPENPPAEWFVVDHFSHASLVGASQEDLATALTDQVRRGAFNPGRLRVMAARYATKEVETRIDRALRASSDRRRSKGPGRWPAGSPLLSVK